MLPDLSRMSVEGFLTPPFSPGRWEFRPWSGWREQRRLSTGETGQVVINPTEEVSRDFLDRNQQMKFMEREIHKYAALPADTQDGVRVRLQANIEMVEEVSAVKLHGAEGVGLYRTEILYLNRKDLPSEEEQFQTYRRVTEKFGRHPLPVRTPALGGD